MPSIYLTLFDHVAWADAQARDAILTIPEGSPARAQAVRLYAHLAGAEHVWLARLEGHPATHAVWPELSLEEAATLAAASTASLRAIAARGDEELMREVEYRNSAGHEFRNTVADVLTHVALHGSYHRGQLALLARQGGGTPAYTDYIAYVRGVAAPAQRN